MNVTRDVVVDLLPLYVAGEGSADTRALVEAFLSEDMELKRQFEQARLDDLPEAGASAVAPPPELELRSLRRTRGVLRWQRITYAWALALSLLPFSTAISFSEGHLSFRWLVLEYPQLLVPCMVLALTCWINYYVLRQRVRVTRA